jgi:hypothetical protein
MIVLDEQLQGFGLEDAIAHWYRGNVIVVNRLRPGRVIKDDAIPTLLRRLKQPTFVTINGTDFWRRVPADKAYCIVCLELPADQASKVSGWLRQLFRVPICKTKRGRMGKVVLASQQRLRYYSTHEKHVHLLRWTMDG